MGAQTGGTLRTVSQISENTAQSTSEYGAGGLWATCPKFFSKTFGKVVYFLLQIEYDTGRPKETQELMEDNKHESD